MNWKTDCFKELDISTAKDKKTKSSFNINYYHLLKYLFVIDCALC